MNLGEFRNYHEWAIKRAFRKINGYDFPCPLKEYEYYNLLNYTEDEAGEDYICNIMCNLIEEEMRFNIKRAFLGQWWNIPSKVKDTQDRIRRVFKNEKELYKYILSFVEDKKKERVKKAKYIIYALYTGVTNKGVNVLDIF